MPSSQETKIIELFSKYELFKELDDVEKVSYCGIYRYYLNKIGPLLVSKYNSRKGELETEYGKLYNDFISTYVDYLISYSYNVKFNNSTATNNLIVMSNFAKEHDTRLKRYYLPYKLLYNDMDTLTILLLFENIWNNYCK